MSGNFNISDVFQSDDGLGKLGGMFVDFAGRELSPEALACVMFLRANGSPDIADDLMGLKRYQVKAKDVIDMTNAMSPAMAHKDLIQAQTAAAKELRGS